MFLDEATVEFSSGRGGSGSASFHREKHVPRGGPNGADGGRGGNIVLIADRSKRTLYDFHLKRSFVAPNGSDAAGNKSGKDGVDVEIRVPVGTILHDLDRDDELIADLAVDGQRFVLCKGGRGGWGNLHFTNSVHQAPKIAQNGAPAETLRVRMELKLLADVGLIGLPNAGKSTLISRISAAKPKIADYPFTTIVPNLGVVTVDDASFTVADMPGLIEGASQGRGLGHQFLKHAERTSVLVHVVEVLPVDESDPVENYRLIERELKEYSEELWARPRLVAASKVDTIAPDSLQEVLKKLEEACAPAVVYPISAVSGVGLTELLRALAPIVQEAALRQDSVVLTPVTERKRDKEWRVERTDDGFKVIGDRLTRLVAMTNIESSEGLYHLHKQLSRIGVLEALEKAGAEDGDTVTVGNFEFEYEADL